ncbi:MAG TPA: GlsB/YeaQ/YmgE family stress response membrane protein [Rhizomicrobium sp.]|jgi:uncharacterized membrane protein YeaQ/YmgE (transglycosylase-associated protein family)|nr:GlsB/YeaQ/YmgE family stress response membrane protein [Rhizomicrobium sp.]
MSILGWIIFGLITGFIASKVVQGEGSGCFLNIALGLVGAVVGGALFSALGTHMFFGFNLTSMFVAILGAIIVLFAYHAITGRR